VPVSNPVASTPVGSAVLWDEQKAEAMFADLARGDTSNLAKYASAALRRPGASGSYGGIIPALEVVAEFDGAIENEARSGSVGRGRRLADPAASPCGATRRPGHPEQDRSRRALRDSCDRTSSPSAA